jgi:Dolichyl-phosphate-mannose-protein mannosyltransferase
VAATATLQHPSKVTNPKRTPWWLLASVFVALLCFFLFVARNRFIDGDEGFYLLASRLVLAHKTPYLDFFYTQAPLLPYVYGMWMKLGGVTWVSARTFSALLTALLGLLVFGQVSRVTGKSLAGLTALALFASSTLVFAWYPIAKTHSLAGLFLFAAYVIISPLSAATSPWWIACSGLLLGLSVDTRSYIAGVTPVFLWWIIQRSAPSRRVAHTLWFLGGLAIGIAPSATLFALSPDRYVFNNLRYHAMRSSEGLIGDWRSKVHIARLVLVGPDDNGLQFGMLSIVGVALAFLWQKSRRASLLAFLIAFFLGLISILPTPAYSQYFCLCMPFLIVSAACLVSDYFGWLRSKAVRWTAIVVCAGLFAGYLALGARGFRHYLITGDVIGIDDPDEAPNWTLARVREVSKAIDEVALPEETVASLWPGYIFESHADAYSGFENNFGWGVSWQLTQQERAKYHVISEGDFESGLAAHVPRIVVLGNDVLRDDPHGGEYAGMLKSNGYALAQTVGDASVYVCCSRP